MLDHVTTIAGSAENKNTWIYQREDKMFMREVEIDSGKHDTEPVRILFFADVHLNVTNKQDEENHEIMYTKQCRKWNADGASVPALEKAMKHGESFDRIVIGGDVLDYLSLGAMELMDKHIWNKDPHVIVTPGGHELTRQMQTDLPDETPLEERMAIVEKFWRHDMHYYKEELGEKAMLIQLDNSQHKYLDCQVERLAKDIETARRKGLAVLIFQHEPISTGRPEDAAGITAIRVSKGAGSTCNFYEKNAIRPEDEISQKVYDLLTKNADVVKAVFCGHCHSAYYTEISGGYRDAEGRYHEKRIPQYVEEGLVYDGYVGHVMEITVL